MRASIPLACETVSIVSISAADDTIPSPFAKPTAKSSRSAGLASMTACVVPSSASIPAVYVRAKTLHPLLYRKRIDRVERAQPGDLVVIGSHGRTGLARVMLGSVAAKVVAQSPVPVLVAR